MEFRSGDALLVFDDDLRIVAWNEAAEELTGIAFEKAVGRPCWEVLGLIGRGFSAKAIADELGIAEPTVRNHIRAVLVELHAHSQLAAVAAARRWHLID
jgi:PAS domain S-box-containing protein